MSTMPNAASRIAAQTRQMQGKDVVCARCGSEHFYEVSVTRYLAGGSGSVEILADPNEQAPHPLLKCAGCDLAVLPKVAVGRRHGGVFETSHKAFRESVEKGLALLKTFSPDAIASEVLGASASKVVESHVEKLEKRVKKLENDLGETDGTK
jgi:hypothetical protein